MTSTTPPTQELSDDAQLLHRIQRGTMAESKQAFSILYQRYVEEIWRFIYNKVQDADAADDISAQVWEIAVAKIQSYTVCGKPFKAWLCAIAGNKMQEYWRLSKRFVPLEDSVEANRKLWSAIESEISEESADVGSRSIEQSTQREDDLLLYQALSKLPEKQRRIILLRYFEGCNDLVEVAEQLEMNNNTVRVFHKRGLEGLRSFLNENYARMYQYAGMEHLLLMP